MKETRFRGIDDCGKIFLLRGIRWGESMTGLCEWQEGSWDWCGFEDYEQWTGILDKNGTEIYVGDKISSYDGVHIVTNIVLVQKLYNNQVIEVIGNIHDNSV